jgi:hypothetical protein
MALIIDSVVTFTTQQAHNGPIVRSLSRIHKWPVSSHSVCVHARVFNKTQQQVTRIRPESEATQKVVVALLCFFLFEL